MRLFLVTLTLAVAVGATGCSSGSGGSGEPRRGARDVITLEELQQHTSINVFEAIRRLRPRWLQARTGAPSGQDFPVVILNEARYGDMNSLQGIQVINVQRIRFMSPRDATTRYGTGFMAGAIVVTSR